MARRSTSNPSNMVLYCNDPALAARRLGSKIEHLKDVFRKPGTNYEDFTVPMLGEGMMD
jgi:sugar phosphate isomerase/epimerase